MLTTGVDIVEIERVAGVLARYGDRFLRRVFTPEEIAYCRGRAPNLAARFAAKEAVMKALGTGFRGVGWRDVEVVRAPSGRPQSTPARARPPPRGASGRGRNRHQPVALPRLCPGFRRRYPPRHAGKAAGYRRHPVGRRRGAAPGLIVRQSLMAVTTAAAAPVKIVTVAQMQALEDASERVGVSKDTLMENAGLGLRPAHPQASGRRRRPAHCHPDRPRQQRGRRAGGRPAAAALGGRGLLLYRWRAP